MRTQRNFKIIFIKIFCALCISSVFSVVSLSSLFADYLWPFKEKTYLTGTFGEFRKNHIHAGVDISTKGRIGLPVYAGASSILCRVKTQYIGFGKTVYLKLPDGSFLVYAHLDSFSPKIEKIVKTVQLQKNKYAVDIYPKSKVHIKKGELIGYSGDTGGVPPHLHMELRDPDERPINPSRNGFNIQDKSPPLINGLAVCDPETSFVLDQYSSKTTGPIHISGKIGLALSAHEKSYGNKLGIYQIDLIVDNNLFFRIKMDSFSYDEFRDNFLVYNKDLYVNNNNIYYNLFRAFDNNLPFYPLNTDGTLDLKPGKHSIAIKAMDHMGNISTLNTTIIAKKGKVLPERKPEKGPWYSEDGKICLEIEKLYSPVDIKIKTLPLNPNHQELVPVSKIYEITPKAAVFKKATISPFNSGKVALYRLEDGKWKYISDNTCRTFTRFCLFKDTTPPTIRVLSPVMAGFSQSFRAKIEDKGSGLDYSKLALYIDGKKVIAEYSVNKKELFYMGQLSPGKHKITWIAVDRAGNQTTQNKLTN